MIVPTTDTITENRIIIMQPIPPPSGRTSQFPNRIRFCYPDPVRRIVKSGSRRLLMLSGQSFRVISIALSIC